jgi:RNA polymerase sigma-70 factor (ECF subfamily)
MSPDPGHLSQISTLWTVLRQAQAGTPDAAQQAQETILQRYTAAIFRYVRAIVKDEDAAHEVYQEFALRFVRGDFRSADPNKGRFRHFLKRVLRNLAIDHHRLREKRGQSLSPEQAQALPQRETAEAEQQFSAAWKMELLARTWDALRLWEEKTGQPFHRVLRTRTENPALDSAALAELLGAQLDRSVNAAWVRNRLHFAREKFAELLVEEVRQTLVQPEQSDLIDELIELDLYERCRSVLTAPTGQE